MERLSSTARDRRLLLAALGLGLVPSSLLARQEPTPERIRGGQDAIRRFTAPVRLAGAAARPLVVDTGANTTVLAEDVASELGLAPAGSALVHGVAGARSAPLVHVPSLEIGTLRLVDRLLPVLPREALAADGLLGLDVLQGRELTLDFRAQRLTIRRPHDEARLSRARSGARDARQIVVEGYRRSGPLTLLRGRTQGQRLDVFVDTGAQQSIGNLALLALAQPLPLGPGRSDAVTIFGAAGDSAPGRLALAPLVEMNGVRLTPWIIPFADIHTFRLWNLTDHPSLILGMDVMRLFKEVVLDLRAPRAFFTTELAPMQLAAAPSRPLSNSG